MKKLISSLFAAVAVFAALADANDTIITFSTPGPDTYEDGTPVLDGECYALVYSPKGVAFPGFSANGAVADPASGCRVVLCAPVARNGHCPYIAFQFDPKAVDSGFKDGTFAVYLLDTRRWNGAVAVPAGVKDGRPVLVNSCGRAADARMSAGAGGANASPGIPAKVFAGATATAGRTSTDGVPSPEITGIEVIDGMVYVTVSNTVDYVNYALREGETPADIAARPGADASAGDPAREIILVSPSKGASGFYSVGRK